MILALLFNINHYREPGRLRLRRRRLFRGGLGVIDLLRYKLAVVLSSRLAHIGVAVMVSESSLRRFIRPSAAGAPLGKYTVIESAALTFRGLTDADKSALAFTFARGRSVSEIETP